MSSLRDKIALKQWDVFRKNIEKATHIDLDETTVIQEKRIKSLQRDVLEFAKYYFPHYCTSDFAPFHKRFFDKVIANDRIYISRAWARDHAKSVCAGVILPLYLKFSGDLKNMILASYNETNAAELLKPIQLELESNQRLINDYGIQKGVTGWEAGNFTTTAGCSFRAIGSGQSPRGTRNQEARPDYILCDDLDEDEMCRNPKRLDDTWDWMQGALLGCFSIKGRGRMVVVGNIIAKDSLVVRASKVADNHDQIDILDKSGQPSWKQRFSLKECQERIKKMGYRIAQREYFNNPLVEGKVFKREWMQFKELPPLKNYKYLVAYLDPGFKNTKTSDSKAWVMIGLYDGKIHIRKVFCDVASVESMVGWGYSLHELAQNKSAACQLIMEEVFLQDLLYKDFNAASKKYGYSIPLRGDKRKKPDKDSRITATSGYFERGDVFYDITIKEDHHCERLVEQYLNFEPGVKTRKDGPDAVEGAIFILQQLIASSAGITIGQRKESKYLL